MQVMQERNSGMTMEKLKPCPFCGKVPDSVKRDGIIRVYDSTTHGCPMSAGWSTPEQWNTRPIEDDLRAERDALQAEVNRQAAEIVTLRKQVEAGKMLEKVVRDANIVYSNDWIECPWCAKSEYCPGDNDETPPPFAFETFKHFDDCPRQLALAAWDKAQ
jgi:hypothetical protein